MEYEHIGSTVGAKKVYVSCLRTYICSTKKYVWTNRTTTGLSIVLLSLYLCRTYFIEFTT